MEQTKPEPRNAVKAFIIKGGKVLLLRRRPNDVHSAGKLDIPGGRLEVGEDPYAGLKRETMEEAGIEIQILAPLDVHYFTRDDGQNITMMIFLCATESEEITLSEEHTEYTWESVDALDAIPAWLHPVVKRYRDHFSHSELV